MVFHLPVRPLSSLPIPGGNKRSWVRIAALLALLCAGTLPAQDPTPPPGGFPVRSILDRVYTYADGYKTTVDVRFPDPAKVTAPKTGWPCVLLVHGLGSNRKKGAPSAGRYAGLGYIAINYDVRGQGSTTTLNPAGGTLLNGSLEKADMAELFHAAKKQLKQFMDFSRLGVRGTSQGGVHSWAAAAWSERKMPTARGSITHFPKITVVAPGGSTPDTGSTGSPEGNAFSGRGMLLFFYNRLRLEPNFRAAGRKAFLTQDFAMWRKMLNDPWREDPALLKTSKVPVFAHNSWDDYWFDENTMVDAANSMPATTPRSVYLSTGNHGSPRNVLEQAHRFGLEIRWFNHFMKGIKDEMPREPRFRLAVTPDDLNTHKNLKSVWSLRQAANYPNTGAQAERFWLRKSGVLDSSPPAGAEASDRVQHIVATGVGPTQWIKSGNVTAKVFKGIPLSQVIYRTAPLSEDRELVGRGKATLFVKSLATNMQVNFALFDDDGRTLRYVAGGFRALRGRRPGVSRHDIILNGANYIFRKGHRIAIAVENHVWHRPIGIDELRTVPYFESYSFDVSHSKGMASSIDLPFRKKPGLSCRTSALQVSQSIAANLRIPLDGNPVRAGEVYVVLAGLSGTVPGLQILGKTLPMNWDSMTTLTMLVAPNAPFVGFVGILDAKGRAEAYFTPPAGLLPKELIGTHISFAGLGLSKTGQLSVSAMSWLTVTK